MKRKSDVRVFLFFLAVLLSASALGGCGSANKEAGPSAQPIQATQVGSQSCINQCHVLTQDILGEVIAVTWQTTTHTTDFNVQCEDCHGGGSLHWGIGPIPYPNPPAAPCNVCHKKNSFDGTRHANGNLIPGSTFTQITTTNNLGRHIEECSVCHNPNQRFEFGFNDVMTIPNPNNLPNPEVACAACHWGGHQPVAATTTVPQKANAKVYYPLFRPFTVDLATGAQSTTGTIIQLSTFQPNGAVQPDGSVNVSLVTGTQNSENNELFIEQLCASCHAQGAYKNSGGATHQEDIYGEWTHSAHGDRSVPAFAEFSALPTAFINPTKGTYYTAADAGHQSLWPYDMSKGSTIGGGGSVLLSTATATANAGVGTTSANDNYPCYRCHNGLTSIMYQDDIQGTPNARVIFGDEPVICITCHDPHTNVPGQTKNTRKPVVMTKYVSTSPSFTIVGNVFVDNTPVPSTTGNATICVFCHQGRESGYTLFKSKLAALSSPTSTLNTNFFNSHYLGTGAMLWARNGYEFSQVTGTLSSGSGMMYGMVTQHQQTNCIGCHMAAAPNSSLTYTVGNHTWKVVSDDESVINNVTCNTSACHGSSPIPSTNSGGEFDNYRFATDTNDYDGDGDSAEGVPIEITALENEVIGLLLDNGIEYDDTAYPYFFKATLAHTSANAFKAWNLATFKAAFNVNFVVKGLPSGLTQINQPNRSAATHNFRYNIEILQDAYTNLYNFMLLSGMTITSPVTINIPPVPGGTTLLVTLPTPTAMFRPVGSRPATNYDPTGGGYNPRQ